MGDTGTIGAGNWSSVGDGPVWNGYGSAPELYAQDTAGISTAVTLFGTPDAIHAGEYGLEIDESGVITGIYFAVRHKANREYVKLVSIAAYVGATLIQSYTVNRSLASNNTFATYTKQLTSGQLPSYSVADFVDPDFKLVLTYSYSDGPQVTISVDQVTVRVTYDVPVVTYDAAPLRRDRGGWKMTRRVS